MVDDDKRRAIIARRDEGESLRTIADGVKVSLAVVHRVVTEHETQTHGETDATGQEAS
jgi:hypothetical protein